MKRKTPAAARMATALTEMAAMAPVPRPAGGEELDTRGEAVEFKTAEEVEVEVGVEMEEVVVGKGLVQFVGGV